MSISFSYANENEKDTYRCLGYNYFGVAYSDKIVLHKTGGLDGATIGGIVCGVIFTFVVLMAVFMYFYSKYMKQKYALYMHPDPKFKVTFSLIHAECSTDLLFTPHQYLGYSVLL